MQLYRMFAPVTLSDAKLEIEFGCLSDYRPICLKDDRLHFGRRMIRPDAVLRGTFYWEQGEEKLTALCFG